MRFLWLLFAHYIGDFALNTDWMALNKGKNWYIMFAHCMVWATPIAIVLEFLSILSFWKIGFLIVGHFIIDSWRVKRTSPNDFWKFLYYDQILHILQLFVVYFIN